MTFTVRWPDGSVEECYSPSLVVHDHLEEGATYAVEDFVSRTVTALDLASARVREKFGFACTSAAATSEQVVRSAAFFSPDQPVRVLRMHPPLPRQEQS
ncbi:MSMEG_0570 family nitrogen starvation response protein [Marmoricola sp. OAE513]|uniref:MSMEG_0570 family nitrogen starvation response protein n=1 Tax=Marmoricola sp. OAE513 TaxID=2817894 RepID=UPI003398CB29